MDKEKLTKLAIAAAVAAATAVIKQMTDNKEKN